MCPVVCLAVKPVGEPDSGNRDLRFDERRWETGRWPLAPSYRAHLRLYLRVSAATSVMTVAIGGASRRRVDTVQTSRLTHIGPSEPWRIPSKKMQSAC